MKTWLCILLASGSFLTAETKPASHLKIGIVQMSRAQSINESRDRIVSGISNAAGQGARVAVFPESALRGEGNDNAALVKEAVDAIRRAARDRNIYVLFGGTSRSSTANKEINWMYVIGPDGRDLVRYDKLYDKHDAQMPGVFHIDGVPCSAFICADRWLRGVEEIPIQQGAKVSFELSDNFANEWVAPYEWYWYVPRALRNNVWVIFANTGNKAFTPARNESRELRHGHSAIIAPNGRIAAAASNDVETVVIADIDLSEATRREALARASHLALQPFWQAGMKLHNGDKVDAPTLTPLKSAETDITMAIAQVTNNLPAMLAKVREARARKVDLLAFPERAIDESSLQKFQTAARENDVTIIIGMEHRMKSARRNSAFVIGPDGAVLTRYDQLSASSPFEPGTDPEAMWFRVKGVPSVVTIGRDALWTELAELAAVAGAQIHVHLANDGSKTREDEVRRLQVWSNLASFHTFTATANVTGSAIWDDLWDSDERRAAVRGLPQPSIDAVEVYSPFSANLVTRAGVGPQLIVATRRVSKLNPHHPRNTSNINPQMDAWYRLGASIIRPPAAP